MAGAVLGSGLLSWTPRAEAATISKTYYITDGMKTMPDGVAVYFQSFADSAGTLNIPASPIICQEGDILNITVINKLATTRNFVILGLTSTLGSPTTPLATTGNILSGATGSITNFTVPAGAAGSYLFVDNTASYTSYLGLHGGLAVMPKGSTTTLYPNSPTFKKQLFWIFNDIDPAVNNAVHNGTTVPTTLTPRYFTINGQTSLPPGATGNGDPTKDAMANPSTMLSGKIGDRTLIRMMNAGPAAHAVHTHANHMEWLTDRGKLRSAVWKKDILYLRNGRGKIDAIYPFEAPPDSYPATTSGHFPMHLHDEMSQTCGGGLYLFGAMTEIVFV